MTVAGIEITDIDSLMAAADILEDAETWITCPDCGGARSITDYSPDAGWINIECPCCEGNGSILAVVGPLFRCATCRDTGRIVKPSAWFAGKTVEGFCPDCTPHFDFASGRFVNCGGDAEEVSSPASPAPVPFDRAAHCRRIASYGGVATVRTHGTHYMRVIRQTGACVTIARHGYDFWRGLMTAKRWTALRQVSFLDDLRAGPNAGRPRPRRVAHAVPPTQLLYPRPARVSANCASAVARSISPPSQRWPVATIGRGHPYRPSVRSR
jgi:hypothetical protein